MSETRHFLYCDRLTSLVRWIPVTDRLPDLQTNVLVFRSGGENKPREARVAFRRHRYSHPPEAWEWIDITEGGWGMSVDGSEITHWMAYPAPPEN